MFLNRVILIGRLTRDPELRYTSRGTPVARFVLAVDRPLPANGKERRAEKRAADFIPVVAWGKQAETCASYLTRGRLVAVEGRLQVRTFEVRGGTRRASEVVGETVRFLDRKRSEEPVEAAGLSEGDLPEGFEWDEGESPEAPGGDDEVPF